MILSYCENGIFLLFLFLGGSTIVLCGGFSFKKVTLCSVSMCPLEELVCHKHEAFGDNAGFGCNAEELRYKGCTVVLNPPGFEVATTNVYIKKYITNVLP